MSAIELPSNLELEWDEAKSDACFERRGFDFAYALHAFVDSDRLIEHSNHFGSQGESPGGQEV